MEGAEGKLAEVEMVEEEEEENEDEDEENLLLEDEDEVGEEEVESEEMEGEVGVRGDLLEETVPLGVVRGSGTGGGRVFWREEKRSMRLSRPSK